MPVRLLERAGIQRVQEPVTVGVPLPKGVCIDPVKLGIRDQDGRSMALQSQVLGRWSDGSAKWVLLDFQATVGAYEEAILSLSLEADAHAAPERNVAISVMRLGAQLAVNTGVAEFVLSKNILRPFERVAIEGMQVCGEKDNSLVVTDEAGREFLPYIDRLELEAVGPLRATVRVEGRLRLSHGDVLADFVARLTWFVRHSDVKLEWTIRNSRAAVHPRGLWDLGDPGSVYFKDCTLHVGGGTGQIESVDWSVDPQQPWQSRKCQSFELYQDSSGGEYWRSSNHVNRFGAITTAFRGYRITTDGNLTDEGNRATPMIRIRTDSYSLAVSVPAFWQNFPKALEVHGRGMSVRFFPRQCRDIFELQPGEQKTHTVFLQWSDAAGASLAWTHACLTATVSPEWYETTKAISHVTARDAHPPSSESERSAQRLINMVVEGANTFFVRRERADEYGWRNFGDLYADHEAVNCTGEQPLIAHYNNQYDVIYGCVVQFARSGDPRWYDLLSDMARHAIDIDLYHTKDDRPALNGGLFWHTDHYTDAGTATHRSYSITSPQAKASLSYGGGPACEHNYAAGFLHYYYLTGYVPAKEAVVSLADWVIQMDDGSSRSLGWLDRRPTGYCSVTATQNYHGPGRGSGNSISVLLDGWALTGDGHYLSKAEALIRRCIHPYDNIAHRHLEDIEYRWSYTVFLQVLGKYLDLKAEHGQLDAMYAYARASLLHYANWMGQHEVPYKQVLHRVLIPTETWPAQDVRKANVFSLAAKHESGEQRALFHAKAEAFFDACLTDLQSFATHTLTRPLVLLMTNAYLYSYCRVHSAETAPIPAGSHDFGRPKAFRSQFHEIYLLREIVQRMLRIFHSGMQSLRVLLTGGKFKEGGHA